MLLAEMQFLRCEDGTCYVNRDCLPKAEDKASHQAKQTQEFTALQRCQITKPFRVSHRIVPYGNLLTGNLVILTLKSAHA